MSLPSDAGLYVHVPFCAAKCDYCGFYSVVPDTAMFAQYFGRLADEVVQKLDKSSNRIKTVFVGGGNPTLLGVDGINLLVETIRPYLDPVVLEEITFETNPETITADVVRFLATLPKIRLSMGIQRLKNSELAILGRRASLDSIYRALDLIFAEIGNVGADFILGVPGCGFIADDLAQLVKLYPLKHISAYFLSVEENTPMQRAVTAGLMQDPADIGPEELFLVRDVLLRAGFEHYEISNYARPGFRCMHNMNYWLSGDYIGLGPAAVSCCADTRTSAPANLQSWIADEPPVIENLSADDRRNEFVMLSLRLLSEGLNLDQLTSRFKAQSDAFFAEVNRQIALGNLIKNGNTLKLADQGLAMADNVMASLFI
ncbi:MAG: radical SAM family heme chaperone HemW [Erysipelotrichia bacterium]|nr:radical SAM family heme chaperone HemW [Erysipelotrichia bacterium]